MTEPTAVETTAPYGSGAPVHREVRRVRVRHLQRMKERGETWPMLTAYDMYAAGIFDAAGIPVMLVGDSAANNVYGHRTTLPVTIEELRPLVRAVIRSTERALIVADLPFGSYEASAEQALATAIGFMKDGAHAVKLEGGRPFAGQVKAWSTRASRSWGTSASRRSASTR